MSSAFQTLVVRSGHHDRLQCPVFVELPEGEYHLTSPEGNILSLQAVSANTYAFVEPYLPANSSRTYRLLQGASGEPHVQLQDEGEKGLSIRLGDNDLTTYHYQAVKARPYFYPLLAPDQLAVTRSYPMIPDNPDEKHDHPHHRSLWIAYGEVNDTDNWAEGDGHGYTEHKRFTEITSGDVFGRFASESVWTTNQHAPLLDQSLVVTTWATQGGVRLMDFDIRLTANYGSVHFNDTKEGGILSARVATVLDVPRTGTITNSFGGVNEGETWGKAAHWCDYSGIVENQRVGIAICDHPHSFRYPTHWHVRDYGLMTANPFGYSYYTKGVKNGSHTMQNGETLEFHYRLILHSGDVHSARINDHYLGFVAPPSVEVCASL